MKRRTILFACAVLAAVFLTAWNYAPRVAARRSSDTAKPQDSRERTNSSQNPAATQINVATATGTEDADAEDGDDPDLPSKRYRGKIDKAEYLRLRDQYIGLLRGIEPDAPINPFARSQAIAEMNGDMLRHAEAMKNVLRPEAVTPMWLEVGPRPIPNGQLQQFGTTAPVTGRTLAVVVNPTNTNIVYIGTAQGGVWRSTDGGTTWTAIFDTAQSLAVGALTLDPNNPSTLFVGTGENNNSADSFGGVGIYRIRTADTTPVLEGPFQTRVAGTGTTASTGNAFIGTGINKIVIDPNDSNKMYVGNGIGRAGISGGQYPNSTAGFRGLYYCGNAQAATPVFSRVNGLPGGGNGQVRDIAYEPGSSSNLLVAQSDVFGLGTSSASLGGIYRSTNANTATQDTASISPTFTLTQALGVGVASKLAVNKSADPVAPVVTVYVATSEAATRAACVSAGQAGRVRKSVDGGVTFPTTLAAADGYCGGQCTYDQPIAVSPIDANTVYVGGNARGTCSDVLKKSSDGGTTFTRDDTGLHADSHFIFFDATPTIPNVWFANDGGIWRRPDSPPGTAWINRNNAPLGTLQFQSVAVHPTDRNYTLGGTQDNGTEFRSSDGNWVSAEGGDGGFALIDQSSPDNVNVTMYHTFYNQPNSQILFDRATKTSCALIKDSWPTRGAFAASANTVGADDNTPAGNCDGTPNFLNNGLQISDNVLFYAPMALGPGTPNTLYFGTDRLYRSTNIGDTMTIVSQSPVLPTTTRTPVGGTTAVSVGTQISAIGISPQDDNVRVIGFINGKVYGTITGSSTLTDISPTPPANLSGSTTSFYISRVVIDPTNKNTAYITFSYFTTTAGQGVFKTTNLNNTGTANPVTWTAAGNGIPSIPINAFVASAALPGTIFAGTDIGVYSSSDGGANWAVYGVGLPRVAVFDLAIQPTNQILRAATHGRGMFEIPVLTPTAATPSISGRVTNAAGEPVGGVAVTLSGGARPIFTVSDSRGFYTFEDVDGDDFYTLSPALAGYSFSPASRSFSVIANVTGAAFTANRDAVISANAIDDTEYFVRQQYLDFLGREPDAGGLKYWSDQIRQCGTDAVCVHRKRIGISAAFFVEQEFQQTGSFVYMFYRSAYGRRPNFKEFGADRGSVIGGINLEANKRAYANEFVQRAEFKTAYPDSLSIGDFVKKLCDTAGIAADAPERQNYVNALTNGTTRAQVVRDLSENAVLMKREYNNAFVLMQYFGYLRRDPDAAGYEFWLDVLNNKVPGNFQGMVCAFLTSREYQGRFGSVITRSDLDCGR